MTDDRSKLERELTELRGRVAALDFLIVSLAAHLQTLSGHFPGLIDSAFDSAANSAQEVGRSGQRDVPHAPIALRHIERLRDIVVASRTTT